MTRQAGDFTDLDILLADEERVAELLLSAFEENAPGLGSVTGPPRGATLAGDFDLAVIATAFAFALSRA